MASLTFYFDPVCPWAWRTSLWVREVQRATPLDVHWKILNLAEINREHDSLAAERAQSAPAFRALVLARRLGGEEAIDRLYLALGRARHERRENLRSEEVIEAALAEAGQERELLRAALDDSSTDQEVLDEHNEAVKRFNAFGVPYLVLGERDFGLFGPVISEVPRGDAALELWEHVSWMLTQPYLYELKRERA